jgi:hypothetical protein
MNLLEAIQSLPGEFLSQGKKATSPSGPGVPVPIGMIGSGTIVSGWNALSTTGKVGVGILGGGLAVGTYDWLFGGKKAAAPITQTPTITQQPSQGIDLKPDVYNVNTTRNEQYDYSTNNNIISNSPYASLGTEKKMGMSAPFNATQNVPFAVSPSQATTARQDTAATSGGTDWATLAAIAGVALVAYGYTSGKGK